MALTIHHLQVSQSERILWLCEELGLSYKLKTYQRSPMLSPPEYLALHPIGAAPVIEHEAVKLAESEACVEYILNVLSTSQDLVVKPGADSYADYLYWYHFANGSLQPGFGRILYLKLAGVTADNPALQRYEEKLQQYLSFVNDRLSQVPYLAGRQFTVADIMPVVTLTTMRQFQSVDLSKYEHILAWLKRVTSRDAYRKAMQKGDPEIKIEEQIRGPPPPLFPALAARK